MRRIASRLTALAVALLAASSPVDAFMVPSAISLRTPNRMMMINSRTALRMSEDEAAVEKSVDVEQDMRARGLDARRKSFFSRNLSEEKLNQKTYYDIEKRGELLVAPDRADEWGEELTEIGKWQRTNGPIYVQGAGGLGLLLGFVNYFALGNSNGLSSPLWSLSVLVALLGFALQRKTE